MTEEIKMSYYELGNNYYYECKNEDCSNYKGELMKKLFIGINIKGKLTATKCAYCRSHVEIKEYKIKNEKKK